MEIVFTESSKYFESDALERQNEDSGERSLMNMFIKEKRENEKDQEDMRQEEDNGRGNGKWHDAVRSEGSYTSLFPLFELIIPARWRCYKDWIRYFAKRNTVLLSPPTDPFTTGKKESERGEETYI